MRRQGCDDPEGDVGGGADVEDYAFRGQAGKKSRVFDCPYAVGDPSGAEYVECGAHAGRAGKFPCVRGGNQPGIAGDGERLSERLRGMAGLISGQAEADHPIIRSSSRQAGGLDRFRRVRVASGEQQDAEADAQPRARAAALVDHRVQDVERGVRIALIGQGVEVRLDPYRSVRGGVLDHLAYQPQKVPARALAHHPGSGAVQSAEVLKRGEAD